MAAAAPAKPKFDAEKFDAVRKRVADMHRLHGDDIRRNAFLRYGAGVFAEMAWLVNQLAAARSLDPLDLPAEEPAVV